MNWWLNMRFVPPCGFFQFGVFVSKETIKAWDSVWKSSLVRTNRSESLNKTYQLCIDINNRPENLLWRPPLTWKILIHCKEICVCVGEVISLPSPVFCSQFLVPTHEMWPSIDAEDINYGYNEMLLSQFAAWNNHQLVPDWLMINHLTTDCLPACAGKTPFNCKIMGRFACSTQMIPALFAWGFFLSLTAIFFAFP